MLTNLHVIRTGVFGVNTIIIPLKDKKCFVVDPAACSLSRDENKIIDFLKKEKMECVGIILTHSHFDHVTGILPIVNAFPDIPIAIHQAEYTEFQNPPGPMGAAVIQFFGALELLQEVSKQPSATVALSEGDTLDKVVPGVGGEDWKVLHTPGHTPGSICLYKPNQILISGDTLFDYGGYGRTDMAGGDEAEIMHSLARLRKDVAAGTKVYPGHDSFGFNFG